MVVSQPSRTILILLRLAKVEHEVKDWNVRANEHKKDEEFMRISPHGTVPTLQVGDWGISETAGIARYINDNFDVPEHVMPKADKKKAAEVDMWLAWNQNTLRPGMMGVFRLNFGHFMSGEAPDVTKKAEAVAGAEKVLGDLDRYLGKTSGAFITGESWNIADIAIWSEVSLYPLLGIDLARWENVKKHTDAVAEIPEVATVIEEITPTITGFVAGFHAKGVL